VSDRNAASGLRAAGANHAIGTFGEESAGDLSIAGRVSTGSLSSFPPSAG
jgi:hypothetical protein